MHPTIVLVHGAFAESASWDRVIDPLLGAEHHVIAAHNPLRGLASDARAVSDLVRTIDGPVLLVAHSYGGAVITNVDDDAGESAFQLAGMFPGSMLGEETLRPVPRSDGTTDLYIRQDRFHDVFGPDVPAPEAARMAVTQRPATQEALVEPSGEHPLWNELPSWFLIGEDDRVIPAALQHYMAERARARRTVAIPGASHAAAVSQADTTSQLILEAAASLITA